MAPRIAYATYATRYAILLAFSSAFVLVLYFLVNSKSRDLNPPTFIDNEGGFGLSTTSNIHDEIFMKSVDFIQNPLPSSAFGLLGARTATIVDWIEKLSNQEIDAETSEKCWMQIEKTVLSLYPFLCISNRKSVEPLGELRSSYTQDRGIVIPTSGSSLRFAIHLIQNLRYVLSTELAIEIAYAGDSDLSPYHREVLRSLGPNISILNVLEKFDDDVLNLNNGGWAIKPFAALASSFRDVILLDADAVFLQDPALLLEDPSFQATGALFFHDRLLWQNVFKDRAKWWRQEMAAADRRPSATLRQSKVWTEGYAEEMDSGAVILDKGRWGVLLGLLHVCWQNSEDPREAITYRTTYGDKESWWFGMELVGTPYAMEQHYGSILGKVDRSESIDKVCAFSIAHADRGDKLLWFNGSLLKNKAVNLTEFLALEAWMMDARWIKGATKQDLSCMTGGTIRDLDTDTTSVLQHSIEQAREADHRFEDILGLSGLS
ncbi:MAG: hypothetical protein Q9165_008208 [Trypethelium subeluteriae]